MSESQSIYVKVLLLPQLPCDAHDSLGGCKCLKDGIAVQLERQIALQLGALAALSEEFYVCSLVLTPSWLFTAVYNSCPGGAHLAFGYYTYMVHRHAYMQNTDALESERWDKVQTPKEEREKAKFLKICLFIGLSWRINMCKVRSRIPDTRRSGSLYFSCPPSLETKFSISSS